MKELRSSWDAAHKTNRNKQLQVLSRQTNNRPFQTLHLDHWPKWRRWEIIFIDKFINLSACINLRSIGEGKMIENRLCIWLTVVFKRSYRKFAINGKGNSKKKLCSWYYAIYNSLSRKIQPHGCHQLCCWDQNTGPSWRQTERSYLRGAYIASFY